VYEGLEAAQRCHWRGARTSTIADVKGIFSESNGHDRQLRRYVDNTDSDYTRYLEVVLVEQSRSGDRDVFLLAKKNRNQMRPKSEWVMDNNSQLSYWRGVGNHREWQRAMGW
jgi:hypothetical protein